MSASTWKQVRRQHAPGSQATLLVSRRGTLIPIEVTFGEEPTREWKIEPDPDASDEQMERLARWLGRAGQEALEKKAEKDAQKPDSADEEPSDR